MSVVSEDWPRFACLRERIADFTSFAKDRWKPSHQERVVTAVDVTSSRPVWWCPGCHSIPGHTLVLFGIGSVEKSKWGLFTGSPVLGDLAPCAHM